MFTKLYRIRCRTYSRNRDRQFTGAIKMAFGYFSCGCENRHTFHCPSSYVEHRCQKHGCGETLVVDGNMKNHRDLCLATNAGYAEYKGLPGRVQTGCPNSLDYKSHFCQLHKPNVAKRQNIQVTDESCTSEVPKESCRDTVRFIIGKHVTRSSTLYQVQLILTKQ